MQNPIPHFDTKPVIASPWTPNLPLHKSDIQSVAVWVQLPDLPLKYWKPEVLGRITSQLGVPIMPDTLTRLKERGQFARVLVHMEIKEEPKTMVYYKNEKGRLIHQPVTYEWTPVKCSKCKGYGHSTMECRKKTELPQRVWKPKTIIQPVAQTVSQPLQLKEQPSQQQHAHKERRNTADNNPVITSNHFNVLQDGIEELQELQKQNKETRTAEEEPDKGIELAVILPLQQPTGNIINSENLTALNRREVGKNP